MRGSLRNIVVASLAVAIAAFAVTRTAATPGGKRDTQKRSVTKFSRVEVGSAFEVDIKSGNTGLTIEADRQALSKIRSQVKNGTLHIWVEGDLRNTGPMRARITTPSLEGLTLSGACRATVSPQKGKRFDLAMDGASSGKLSLQHTEVNANLSGASQLTVSGSTGTLNLEASGASVIAAEKFTAKVANVEFSGASVAKLKVTQSMTGNASGASSITAGGGGAIRVNKSGTSTVTTAR